jgi:tetratricopeptide (TPR) repeat protein
VAVVVTAVLVVIGPKLFPPEQEAVAPPLGPKPRTVVAAFANRTGDNGLDHLGQLAADRIAQELAAADLVVEVVPLSDASQADDGVGRASDTDPRKLGQATDARLVISGAYYATSEELQFQARITDALTGSLVQSVPQMGGPRADPQQAITPLCQRVLGALAMLVNNPLRQPPPAIPPTYEAYQAFLIGMEILPAPKGFGHLQRAAALDSTFLRPKLILALLLATYQPVMADSLIAQIQRVSERLTPYERHTLNMTVADRAKKWEEALRYARLMVNAAPDCIISKERIIYYARGANHPREAVNIFAAMDLPEALYANEFIEWMLRKVADAYHLLGEFENELALVRKIRLYYPSYLRILGLEARALAALGRIAEMNKLVDAMFSMPTHRGDYALALSAPIEALRWHGFHEESRALAQRILDWRATRPAEEKETWRHKVNVYFALCWTERWDDAAEVLADLMAGERQMEWYLGQQGCLAARRGDREEALRICEEIRQRSEAKGEDGDLTSRAEIQAILGDKEEAVALLREAFAQGQWYTVGLYHSIAFEPLRGYPPFEELMRPKG